MKLWRKKWLYLYWHWTNKPLKYRGKLENKNSDLIVYYFLPHPKCIFIFFINLLFFFCNGIISTKPSAFWHALDKVDIDLVLWGVDRSNLSDLSGGLINPDACFTCQRSSYCCHSKAGIRENVLLPQLFPYKAQNLRALTLTIQAFVWLDLLEPIAVCHFPLAGCCISFRGMEYAHEYLWLQFIDCTWTVTATPWGCILMKEATILISLRLPFRLPLTLTHLISNLR